MVKIDVMNYRISLVPSIPFFLCVQIFLSKCLPTVRCPLIEFLPVLPVLPFRLDCPLFSQNGFVPSWH